MDKKSGTILAAACGKELLVDCLYGPMWYRLLNGHASLDRSFAERLVEQLLTGAQSETRA